MASIIDKAKAAIGAGSTKSQITIADQPIHTTGYGLMGLTWRKSPPSQEQAFSAMRAALSAGANFWNGGEIYGPPDANSLQLLHAYFTEHPQDAKKVVISIKGGMKKGEMAVDGSPENTTRSIEECLKVLDGKKKLDVWESARVDPKTPIETTMRAAEKFVQDGRLGGIGLSECSAKTIRRAAAVTKIAAVEVEFSLWSTEILTNGIAEACGELEIPIVAYSPLGRGFLTGQIKKYDDIPDDDMRKNYPRFQPENFDKNYKLVEELERLARNKGCTPGQVGTAWVKAQSRKPRMPVFIPIPGATTAERVEENSVDVELSDNDIKEIDSLLEKIPVEGGRYPEAASGLLEGDTPELPSYV